LNKAILREVIVSFGIRNVFPKSFPEPTDTIPSVGSASFSDSLNSKAVFLKSSSAARRTPFKTSL